MSTPSKRAPGPFSFCTKHPHSFYKSCGCPIPGTKRVKEPEVESTFEDIPQPNAALDV